MLFGLFNKKKNITPKNRVILEGGFQDDWWTQTRDFWRYDIKDDINRLIISNYKLDLVGKLNSENDLEITTYREIPRVLDLDYDTWNRIQRPTTLIVDDGRVYHDKQLMEGCNSKRLPSFLDYLKDMGGFEKIYREYF